MDSILPLLQNAKKASCQIALLSNEERTSLVIDIAQSISYNEKSIIQANRIDADKMEDTDPKKDRLMLDSERIKGIVADSKNVANLPDPIGIVQIERVLENNIQLQKISVPLGVVGVIYESRPNVTMDVAVLALKSGNAVILRGGSDAENSNIAIVNVIQTVLEQQNLSRDIVQLLPTDRVFVKELLESEKYVDIIIPRGSAKLIAFVRENSKIPTIETGAGVCHTFVDKTADLEKARNIVLNAKLQRPSVCNSLDTIIVQKDVYEAFLPMIVDGFLEKNVEIFADEKAYNVLKDAEYPFLNKATEDDFGREFLSFACSVKVVDSFDQALDHIAQYSSKHSEAIISEDKNLCERFLQEVDAAAVYSNASTRFTDGGIFGLGAEIGISTQKLHARGPFALEKLVTEKWILRGDGQIRE